MYWQRFKSIEECFWEKVGKFEDDVCWVWRGAVNSKGRANFRGKSAPRKAYELAIGPIPEGMNICHKCDNPKCCNPMHLFPGTQNDNVQDMIRKGRKKYLHGESAAHRKLDWPSVSEIRALYSTGRIAGTEIARRFGIGTTQVYRILRGEHWKDSSVEVSQR
jgi:hypothetical protein